MTKDHNETGNDTLKVTTGFIESIIGSYARLWRAVLFFTFIAIILSLLIIVTASYILSSGDVSVEMNKEGRLIYKHSGLTKNSDLTYTSFLLPSNELWYDTGIELEANQKIKISITGRAHLAVHKLVESAQKNEKSPVSWCGPEGSDWGNLNENKDQLEAKKKLLIKPGGTIGNVLLYMCPVNKALSFKNDFIKSRSAFTNNVLVYSKNQEYLNTNPEKTRIFLTVNDILLDFADSTLAKVSEIAYQRPGRPNNFNFIRSLNYSDVWFSDNIGSFLVNVEISSKDK